MNTERNNKETAKSKQITDCQQVISALTKLSQPFQYIEDEVRKDLPKILSSGSFNSATTAQLKPFEFKVVLPLAELHYYDEKLPKRRGYSSGELHPNRERYAEILHEYAQHFCNWNGQYKPKGDISKIKISRNHDSAFLSFCSCESCLDYREVIMHITGNQFKAAHVVLALRDNLTKSYKPLLKSAAAVQRYKEAAREKKDKFSVIFGNFNKAGVTYFDFVNKIPCFGNMVLILFSTILMVNDPMNLLQVLSVSLECVIQGFCHGAPDLDKSQLEKNSAEKFLLYILDGYNELTVISQKVAHSLFAMESDFLRKFKLNWILLSQRLFQVYIKSVHADSLLKCVIKLKEEEVAGQYSNIIKKYITFEENMNYVKSRWNLIWQELNKFNFSEEEVSRRKVLLNVGRILEAMYADATALYLPAGGENKCSNIHSKPNRQKAWLDLLSLINQKCPNGIIFPPKTLALSERCVKCIAPLDYHTDNCTCITCSIAGGPNQTCSRGICSKCQINSIHNKDPTLKRLKIVTKGSLPDKVSSEVTCKPPAIKKVESDSAHTIYHIAWAVFKHIPTFRRYNYTTLEPGNFCQDNCRMSACLLARKILNNELSPMVSKQLVSHYQPISISREELCSTLPCIMFFNRVIPNCVGDVGQQTINSYILKMYWTFVLSIYANFFIEYTIPSITRLDNLKISNNELNVRIDDIVGNAEDTKFEEFLECIKRLTPLISSDECNTSLDVHNERLQERLSDLMAMHDAQQKRSTVSSEQTKPKHAAVSEGTTNRPTGAANGSELPKTSKEKAKKCCWDGELGDHCKETHSKKRVKKECHHGRYNETRERLRKKLMNSRQANANGNSTSTSECATNANSAATSRTASHSEPSATAISSMAKTDPQPPSRIANSEEQTKFEQKSFRDICKELDGDQSPEALETALENKAHAEKWINEKLDFIEGKNKQNQPQGTNPKKAAKKAKQRQRKEEEKRVNELQDLRGQFHDIYFKEFADKHELRSLKSTKKRDKKRLTELESNIKKLQRAKAKVETAILELIATVKQSNSDFKFSYLPTKEQQLEKLKEIEGVVEPKSDNKKEHEPAKNSAEATKYIELDKPFFSGFSANIAISNTITRELSTDPGGMITIKRIHNPNNSEAQVTVTAKGYFPGEDKLLGKFVNGNWVKCNSESANHSGNAVNESKLPQHKEMSNKRTGVNRYEQLLNAMHTQSSDTCKKGKTAKTNAAPNGLETEIKKLGKTFPPALNILETRLEICEGVAKKKKKKAGQAKTDEPAIEVPVKQMADKTHRQFGEHKKKNNKHPKQLQNNPFQTLHLEETTDSDSGHDNRLLPLLSQSKKTQNEYVAKTKLDKVDHTAMKINNSINNSKISLKAATLPQEANRASKRPDAWKKDAGVQLAKSPNAQGTCSNNKVPLKKSNTKHNSTGLPNTQTDKPQPLLPNNKAVGKQKQQQAKVRRSDQAGEQQTNQRKLHVKRCEAQLADIRGIPDNMGYFDARAVMMAPSQAYLSKKTNLDLPQKQPVSSLDSRNFVGTYDRTQITSKVSIMDQLNQGVSVEHLSLPPGITLTKVDPCKSEELRQKSEAMSRLMKPLPSSTPSPSVGHLTPSVISSSPMATFYNSKYPASRATDRSSVIMVENTPKLPAASNQLPKQPASNSKAARRRRRNKAKSTSNVPEAQRRQSHPDPSKMVTLRNPLFHTAPTNAQEHSLLRDNTFDASAANDNLPVDQPAAIIKNENGMLTIRNPALHQAVTSGLSLGGYRPFGNPFYSPQILDSDQQICASSEKNPSNNTFSYFSTGSTMSSNALNTSPANNNNTHSNISINSTNNFSDSSTIGESASYIHSGRLTGEAAVIARPKSVNKNISAIGSEMKLKTKVNMQFSQYPQDYPAEFSSQDTFGKQSYFNGFEARSNANSGAFFDCADNHLYQHTCDDETPPPVISGYNPYLDSSLGSDIVQYEKPSYLQALLPGQIHSNDISIQNISDIPTNYGTVRSLFEQQRVPETTSSFCPSTNDFINESSICAQTNKIASSPELHCFNYDFKKSIPSTPTGIQAGLQDHDTINRLMMGMQNSQTSPFSTEGTTDINAFVRNMNALHISVETNDIEKHTHPPNFVGNRTDPSQGTDDIARMSKSTNWW